MEKCVHILTIVYQTMLTASFIKIKRSINAWGVIKKWNIGWKNTILIKNKEILSKFPRIKCLYELNIFLTDTLNTTKHLTKKGFVKIGYKVLISSFEPYKSKMA